jgi:peptidoglycan biosynthesis protein MviN/MurJ (putative lipid II flippase)
MELWVGPAQYGGHLLTVLVGLNVLLVGRAALLTYLLGGSGQIRRSARIIFTEAAARVAAALALLFAVGMHGMPLAGMLTTAVSALVALAWLRRRLEGGAPSMHPLAAWAGYALLLAGAAWIGGGRLAGSWAGFAAWAAALGLAGAGLLAALDPAARAFAAGGVRALRLRAAARGGEAAG